MFCLDATVPALTSAQIFEAILDRCIHICQKNFDIFEPNQYTAPAACVQAFLNGAVGVRLLSHEQWVKAYLDDIETAAIVAFVQNPGTVTTKSMDAANLHAMYRAALRHSQIALEDGILIMRKPIAGSESYARLQIFPSIFAA